MQYGLPHLDGGIHESLEGITNRERPWPNDPSSIQTMGGQAEVHYTTRPPFHHIEHSNVGQESDENDRKFHEAFF